MPFSSFSKNQLREKLGFRKYKWGKEYYVKARLEGLGLRNQAVENCIHGPYRV